MSNAEIIERLDRIIDLVLKLQPGEEQDDSPMVREFLNLYHSYARIYYCRDGVLAREYEQTCRVLSLLVASVGEERCANLKPFMISMKGKDMGRVLRILKWGFNEGYVPLRVLESFLRHR